MITRDILYEERPPRPSLAAFVQCVWTYQSPSECEVQPITPDGMPELIVHMGAPYLETGADAPQAPAVMAGQLTRPLSLTATGEVAVIGVRFRPDGAKGFVKRSMDSITDKRIELRSLYGKAADELVTRVRKTGDLAAGAGLAETFVEENMREAKPLAPVRDAVMRIMDNQSFTPPASMSERQFQRIFRSEVGVSPRLLTAIRRFRRVFDALEDETRRSWAAAALDAGYFDQPQLARDFRRFLGCTAREWAELNAGLAKSLNRTQP